MARDSAVSAPLCRIGCRFLRNGCLATTALLSPLGTHCVTRFSARQAWISQLEQTEPLMCRGLRSSCGPFTLRAPAQDSSRFRRVRLLCTQPEDRNQQRVSNSFHTATWGMSGRASGLGAAVLPRIRSHSGGTGQHSFGHYKMAVLTENVVSFEDPLLGIDNSIGLFGMTNWYPSGQHLSARQAGQFRQSQRLSKTNSIPAVPPTEPPTPVKPISPAPVISALM